jgi:tryptophan synthase beta subunit
MRRFIGRPVSHGLKTLKEAVDSAFEAYLADYENFICGIGSIAGPHPFPLMVRDFQRVVGVEAREQFLEVTGNVPDVVEACVGGGSNAMGIIPAIESTHAVAHALVKARALKTGTILVNLSGRGDKDLD